MLLAFRGPGDLVGELAALDDEPRSATVEALEPVQALAIGHDAFRAFLIAQPAAGARRCCAMLSARLRDADAKRVQLAGYTTLGRVAFCLLELCERFGEGRASTSCCRSPRRSWRAGRARRSSPSAARCSTMRKLGWIETRRRAIRVLDPAALEGATRPD